MAAAPLLLPVLLMLPYHVQTQQQPVTRYSQLLQLAAAAAIMQQHLLLLNMLVGLQVLNLLQAQPGVQQQQQQQAGQQGLQPSAHQQQQQQQVRQVPRQAPASALQCWIQMRQQSCWNAAGGCWQTSQPQQQPQTSPPAAAAAGAQPPAAGLQVQQQLLQGCRGCHMCRRLLLVAVAVASRAVQQVPGGSAW
jgi:hypothetical protein